MLRFLVLVVAACASVGVAATQETAIEKEVKRLAIPKSLTPKGKQPLFMVRADGFQIYKADAKLEWTFEAPQATLLDYRTGDEVGTHSKGPVWIDAKGSKLTGKGIGNEPAPNPQAIPWLLLEVKNENGGQYAKVTHMQRVDTWAGLKPTAAPTKVGEIIKVRLPGNLRFLG